MVEEDAGLAFGVASAELRPLRTPRLAVGGVAAGADFGAADAARVVSLGAPPGVLARIACASAGLSALICAVVIPASSASCLRIAFVIIIGTLAPLEEAPLEDDVLEVESEAKRTRT